MRYAFVFPNSKGSPRGSITRAIFDYAERKDISILYLDKKEDWDSYDALICYHNKPFEIKTSAKICWWMNDLRPINKFSHKVPIDYIFLCNKQYMKAYAKYFNAKVLYLPQTGIPPKMQYKISVTTPYDALFIGSVVDSEYHKERYPILEAISEKYKVGIISNERFTPESYALYKKVKFCLSISPNMEGYTSNRTYNILSSGGFCLIKYFKGIEELFENKKHLVWFKTANEAIKIMDYYMKHEDERKRIAKEGKKFYKANHTIDHRIDAMIDFISK